MLDPNAPMNKAQRQEIKKRFDRFLEQSKYTQTSVAKELGIKGNYLSELLRFVDKSSEANRNRKFAELHNWMELAARRDNLVHNKSFVEISVATEVMQVASIVAETCKIGVVFGPAQIGKTMTLQAIAGDQRFGDPVLITVDESAPRALPTCRRIASAIGCPTGGTFDTLFARLIQRLEGTKRMLLFDEADKLVYKAIETIRQLHDRTGCPVLFCGKPAIYESLGMVQVGDFSEKLDQIIGRIVIKRDLTERTRGDKPKPLYSIDDIKKLIGKAELNIKVGPDAVRWLQARAGAIGMGGLGITMTKLYLAYKLVMVRKTEKLTAEHLDQVDALTMGSEDAHRFALMLDEHEGMRRVVAG